MDRATIQAILARQSAPDTPENINRIIEFGAANPDVLERYGRGLAPGLDDNSALLRLALDRSIARTDGVAPPAAAPVAGPQAAPQQARIASSQARAAPSRQGNYGPGNPTLPPGLPQGTPERDLEGYDVSGPNPGMPDWLKWLFPAILGIRAAAPRAGDAVPNLPSTDVNRPEAAYIGRMQQAGQADPRAAGYFPRNAPPQVGQGTDAQIGYQPKLENQGPTQVRNSPELEQKGKERADKYAKDYADVQEENAIHRAQMMEEMKRRKSQEETLKTLKAGNRAIGRK